MDEQAHPAPQSPVAPKTAAAVAELIEELGRLDRGFLEGDRAQHDLPTALEGYRWMFSILSVGLETFLWADTTAPRFVDIVGSYRKWGGDNSDAFYQYAPIDPAGTYRVSGTVADAVYFSLTVYGGPDDGRYSERIVGIASATGPSRWQRTVRSRSGCLLTIRPPTIRRRPTRDRRRTPTWIRLEPDAVCAITRDYLTEPVPQAAHDVADRAHRPARRCVADDRRRTWPGASAPR